MSVTRQLIWIYNDSPIAPGEIKSVKNVNSDGWFITIDGELIDFHWCCPCTPWQEYDGGFALFEQDTGRIVETRDIKKYLIEVGDWIEEVAIASHFGLAVQLVRTWLKNNHDFLLCREVRDWREWRIEECDSQSVNGTGNDNSSQKVTICDSVLSLENAETLQDFEQLIRDNLQGFYAVGKALIEIRDRQLYIDLPEINTFEEYCKSPLTLLRLGISSKGRAYQFMDAANAIAILKKSPLVTQLPANEGQIRPMVKAKLNASQIVEAWSKAVEQAPSNKPPTGAIVADVVRQIKERTHERLGILNPYSEGDVLRFNNNGDPETRTRNKSWVIVNYINEFSCIVSDFEGEFVAHVNQLERLEVTTTEKQAAVILRERLARIDKKQELAKLTVNYFARLEQFNLTEQEEAILDLLDTGHGSMEK
jgi:hypothetical protein